MSILRANRSGITRFSAVTRVGGDALGGGAEAVGVFCEANGVAVVGDRGDEGLGDNGVAVSGDGDGGEKAGEDNGGETATRGAGEDDGDGAAPTGTGDGDGALTTGAGDGAEEGTLVGGAGDGIEEGEAATAEGPGETSVGAGAPLLRFRGARTTTTSFSPFWQLLRFPVMK